MSIALGCKKQQRWGKTISLPVDVLKPACDGALFRRSLGAQTVGAAMHVLLLLAFLALAGCSTPYQEMGFSGGVAAQQMTANTFRISSRGNGYTARTAIQDYTVLKAAETAKQAGGTHFIIISAADASSAGYITTPGQAQTSVIGNTAYTTYSPGMVHQYVKPGQDTYIRVLTLAPGQAPPPGAWSADEIIQFVGRRVQRPT